MLRGLKLFGLFARISTLNEMQYRANFFIQLLQSFISLGTGLAVLAVVFSYTDNLHGWSGGELLAVMGVHILMGGIMRTVIQPNMGRLMEDVQEGTLDYALTKPEDSQVMVSVRQFAIWAVVDVLMGIIVLAWALVSIGNRSTLASALLFVVALILGAVMIYCVFLMFTTLAFWFVRVWELMEMFQSLYQAGRWPVGIYPDWLRAGLTYLIPVAFAVTVPAEALTGRLTPQTILIAAGFTVVLMWVSRQVWMYGLRHYTSASS
jgi:ABC-2 type transport system permease protein